MDDLNALPLPALFERLVAGPLLDRLIDLAIAEDLGEAGDITSESIIPENQPGRAEMRVRGNGVVAGLAAVERVMKRFGCDGCFRKAIDDGSCVEAGGVLGVVEAPLRTILGAERLILNLVGHLSGIATLSCAYVEAIEGTGAAICETRKTTPGMRGLEKYAARCGGAMLHRIGLFDAALFKDNHLAHIEPAKWTSAISEAVNRLRTKHGSSIRFVQVEVDTLDQLERVLAIERGLIDYVLLDNFTPEELRVAVRLRQEHCSVVLLEASGGISLKNVRDVAGSGVDRISVGAITHAASALDVGLDIQAAS